MDTKKIVYGVVAVTIAVIISVSLLIPVISDGTKTTATLDNTNGSLAYMTAIDSTSTYTLSWDPSDDPSVITVNGDELELNSITVLCSNGDWLIRASHVGSNYGLRGYALASTLRVTSDSTSEDYAKLSISIASGAVTCTKTLLSAEATVTTVTDTITSGYAVAKTGSYVMKASTQSAYLANTSEIVAMGVTTLDGTSTNVFYISGTINDLDVEQVNPNPATYTISDVGSDAALASDYKNTYTVKAITFKATQIADTTKVTDCTYDYFIVPATVTVELAVHPDSATISILNVIPLLVIVGIVLATVGFLKFRD